MALFSNRFWIALINHDRRLSVASAEYEQALSRFFASRAYVSSDAQTEFRLELCEALGNLRLAVSELRDFQLRNEP